MTTLERAIEIAAGAHRKQRDKAGQPYILHPLRVMFRMTRPRERIVAVLHDVLEDCPQTWTAEKLQAEGFADDVVQAVVQLTKRADEHDDNDSDEGYRRFIARIRPHALARRVKLADLADNLDVSRLQEFDDKAAGRVRRYLAARERLLAAESEDADAASSASRSVRA